MKNRNILPWVLSGILLLDCGCAVLKSSDLQMVDLDKGDANKMVYCLPKGMINIKRKLSDKQTPTMELTVKTTYIPDRSKYYTLEYKPNPTYEETINIILNNDMMLQQITLNSKPKIGEIIAKVFELGKEIAKIAFTGPGIRGPELKEKFFDINIDPDLLLKYNKELKQYLLNNELTSLRSAIKQHIVSLSVTKDDLKKADELKKIMEKESKIIDIINRIPQNEAMRQLIRSCYFCDIEDISLIRLFTHKYRDNVTSSTKGIYYRPLLPYRLEVRFPDALFVQDIYLPNEAPLICWDLRRPMFADRITSLQFQNGVLTQINLTRPSEILAFVKLPVDLAKSIAGMPLELLQFRVQHSQEYNNLLAEQIKEIQQKQKLLELQQGITQ